MTNQDEALRDEFAARAMEALIPLVPAKSSVGELATRAVARRKENIAERAYEIADAMMEARRNEES